MLKWYVNTIDGFIITQVTLCHITVELLDNDNEESIFEIGLKNETVLLPATQTETILFFCDCWFYPLS